MSNIEAYREYKSECIDKWRDFLNNSTYYVEWFKELTLKGLEKRNNPPQPNEGIIDSIYDTIIKIFDDYNHDIKDEPKSNTHIHEYIIDAFDYLSLRRYITDYDLVVEEDESNNTWLETDEKFLIPNFYNNYNGVYPEKIFQIIANYNRNNEYIAGTISIDDNKIEIQYSCVGMAMFPNLVEKIEDKVRDEELTYADCNTTVSNYSYSGLQKLKSALTKYCYDNSPHLQEILDNGRKANEVCVDMFMETGLYPGEKKNVEYNVHEALYYLFHYEVMNNNIYKIMKDDPKYQDYMIVMAPNLKLTNDRAIRYAKRNKICLPTDLNFSLDKERELFNDSTGHITYCLLPKKINKFNEDDFFIMNPNRKAGLLPTELVAYYKLLNL